MNEKQVEQLIDEKLKAMRAAAEIIATRSQLNNAIAGAISFVAGLATNTAYQQEIREQIDWIKWRIVMLEEAAKKRGGK